MTTSNMLEVEALGPVSHTVISISIGVAVWRISGQALAIPTAIATGVLVDSDHVLDYLDSYLKGYRRHLLVPFHAWEYLLVALPFIALWHSPLLLAAILAYLGHLGSDQLANRVYPLSYSILYRASQRFSYNRLVRHQRLAVAGKGSRLWGHIEPRLWRIIYKKYR